MSRRRTALATALSLLPLGQPLLLGTLGITTATTAVVLQQGPAVAQDSSAVARIAKAITFRTDIYWHLRVSPIPYICFNDHLIKKLI